MRQRETVRYAEVQGCSRARAMAALSLLLSGHDRRQTSAIFGVVDLMSAAAYMDEHKTKTA